MTIEKMCMIKCLTATIVFLVTDQRKMMAFPHEKIISMNDSFVYLDPDSQQDYPIR